MPPEKSLEEFFKAVKSLVESANSLDLKIITKKKIPYERISDLLKGQGYQLVSDTGTVLVFYFYKNSSLESTISVLRQAETPQGYALKVIFQKYTQKLL